MAAEPIIVCAANRDANGFIVLGIRHFDMHMRAHFERIAKVLDVDIKKPIEQGFVDQFGKFYSRTEAWKVAEAAGQIRHRCGGDTANGGTLYSENLY